MKTKLQTLAAAVLMAVASPAIAAPETKEEAGKEAAAKPVPETVMFTSTHSGTFGGQKMAYRV